MIKIIFLGSISVGKTTLIKKIEQKDFENINEPTIACEVYINKKIKIQDKNYKLELWDTSGEEQYRSITKMQYRGSRGIILMFDITNKKTFKEIKNYLIDIENLCDKIPILLIGNKIDCIKDYRVKKEKINKLLEKNKNIYYKEISVLKENNFDDLLKELLMKILSIGEEENNEIINKNIEKFYNKEKKQKKSCCAK